MAFIVSHPRAYNFSSIRSTPRCAYHAPNPKTSRTITVAAVAIAAAGLVANFNPADAFELPQLPLPPLPSVSIPGLPDLPKLSGESRPKDAPADISQEEEGKFDDMMTKLDAKKKARVTKM